MANILGRWEVSSEVGDLTALLAALTQLGHRVDRKRTTITC